MAKLLILSQPRSAACERILWIDADIIISHNAINILEFAPDPRLIGIAAKTQMSDAERNIYMERAYQMPVKPSVALSAHTLSEKRLFAEYGIDTGMHMLNTGVLVLSPAHHRALFERLYQKEDRGRLYEQPYLVEAMFKEKLLHEISPRFNWSVHEDYVLVRRRNQEMDIEQLKFFLQNQIDKAYFLHFCGAMPMLRLATQITAESGDFLGVGQ